MRRRPDELLVSADPDRVTDFLRSYVEQPGDRLILLDDETYRALPADLLERTELVAERSALRGPGLRPDVPARLAGSPGMRPGGLETIGLLAVVEPRR